MKKLVILLCLLVFGLLAYRTLTKPKQLVHFSLQDIYGRTIQSKKLFGARVPIFLEFGAAW